jgi:hypothetical protein
MPADRLSGIERHFLTSADFDDLLAGRQVTVACGAGSKEERWEARVLIHAEDLPEMRAKARHVEGLPTWVLSRREMEALGRGEDVPIFRREFNLRVAPDALRANGYRFVPDAEFERLRAIEEHASYLVDELRGAWWWKAGRAADAIEGLLAEKPDPRDAGPVTEQFSVRRDRIEIHDDDEE